MQQENGELPSVVVSGVLRGVPVLYGEYRMSHPDSFQYENKKTKREVTAHIVRHTVEGGSQSYAITEWLAPGVSSEQWVSPFQKGERVLVLIDGMEIEKGVPTLRGKLERV